MKWLLFHGATMGTTMVAEAAPTGGEHTAIRGLLTGLFRLTPLQMSFKIITGSMERTKEGVLFILTSISLRMSDFSWDIRATLLGVLTGQGLKEEVKVSSRRGSMVQKELNIAACRQSKEACVKALWVAAASAKVSREGRSVPEKIVGKNDNQLNLLFLRGQFQSLHQERRRR